LLAKLTGKWTPSKNCLNCFRRTRESIDDFFEYLDCDKDGKISAEDMHV